MSTGTPPDISIVIPTYQRWRIVADTLRALSAQDVGDAAVEVVVVDNGSSDGAWEALRDEGQRALGGGAGLVCERETQRGSGPARNRGLLAARAERVLFLDDDIRPVETDFVARHLAADPGECATGPLRWSPGIEVTPVMRWLAEAGKLNDYGGGEPGPVGPASFYTSNVSVPRAAVIEAGGFDQRFQGYGWEDPELGLRLEDAGVLLRFDPELVAFHHHSYDLGASLRRMEAMGRAADLLLRIRPDTGSLIVPNPQGPKAVAGRLLAPAAGRLPYKWGHFAVLARGFGAARLPDSEGLAAAVTGGDGGGARPPVSVILPFAGDAAAAERTWRALGELRLGDGDEVIVVDNTPAGVLEPRDGARVIRAAAEQTPYHARNAGAREATHDWMLLLDAECVPRPVLIDAYFAAAPADDIGAVAGPIVHDPSLTGAAARYQRSRGHFDQWGHLHYAHKPFAVTGNMLIRRTAYDDVGGFTEGIRSGGDADFSMRVQDAGWKLGFAPRAAVTHVRTQTVRKMIRQQARYGAGRAWLEQRRPGSQPPPVVLRRVARSLAGSARWALGAQWERARFALIDAAVAGAERWGYARGSNLRQPGTLGKGI